MILIGGMLSHLHKADSRATFTCAKISDHFEKVHCAVLPNCGPILISRRIGPFLCSRAIAPMAISTFGILMTNYTDVLVRIVVHSTMYPAIRPLNASG